MLWVDEVMFMQLGPSGYLWMILCAGASAIDH